MSKKMMKAQHSRVPGLTCTPISSIFLPGQWNALDFSTSRSNNLTPQTRTLRAKIFFDAFLTSLLHGSSTRLLADNTSPVQIVKNMFARHKIFHHGNQQTILSLTR
jgi:hypothetical protein